MGNPAGNVWLAVMTRPRLPHRLAGMRSRIVICAAVVALLALAALGFVLRSTD